MQSARQLILKYARRDDERTNDMYQKVRLADPSFLKRGRERDPLFESH